MIPSPGSLGLPSKFRIWRPNQWQAIQDGLDCTKRIAVQVQRGGRGKTTTYMTQATIAKDSRVVLLTTNKGLADQCLEDWGEHGLVDIRGKGNYLCDGMPGRTCEEGQVSGCIYKGTSQCGHVDATYQARDARMVLSNYACFMASYKYGRGFGEFDLMICDEAHTIPKEVASAMRVSMSERDLQVIKRDWPLDRKDMTVWKQWSAITLILAQKELDRIQIQVSGHGHPPTALAAKLKAMQNFTRQLADIALCRPQRWIVTEWVHGYQFDVIDASAYVERMLFRGIPKIILPSGTIRPKTLEMCGVERKDYEFFDYVSDINPSRSPLIHVRTGIRMNRNTPDYQLKQLVRYIDKIIAGRLDRKGIIHTANFKLRDFIKAHSFYGPHMFSNYKGEAPTSDIINQFKAANPPAVLISPSVTMGYDFPLDYCRYQIIAKLPYEDISTDIVQARLELDPEYANYNMMQSLAQAFSRGDRGDEDSQEVFVLDDNIGQAMWRHSDLAPAWLPAYFSVVDDIPVAPVFQEVL